MLRLRASPVQPAGGSEPGKALMVLRPGRLEGWFLPRRSWADSVTFPLKSGEGPSHGDRGRAQRPPVTCESTPGDESKGPMSLDAGIRGEGSVGDTEAT